MAFTQSTTLAPLYDDAFATERDALVALGYVRAVELDCLLRILLLRKLTKLLS